MKKKVTVFILTALLSGSMPAQASDADCSIWLCLPMGFPSGCSDAKKAFKKRIKKMKSPLPDFAGCMVKGVDMPQGVHISKMDAKHGVAAIMSYSEQCSKYEYDSTGQRQCLETKMLPNSIIKGKRCEKEYFMGSLVKWSPYGCKGTTKWVETFMDGNRYGDRIYY